MARVTKAQRLAAAKFYQNLLELEGSALDQTIKAQIPEAWYTIERDLDVEEKKVKISLWLDESVAKTFRKMGRGYQARINRILATWLQLKMLDVKREQEIFDKYFGLSAEGRQALRDAEAEKQRGGS